MDGLASALLVSHILLANITQTPELALEKSEADILANGALPLLDEVGFTPPPIVMKLMAFGACAAQVYGPRIYLIAARKQAEKDARMKRARPAETAAPDMGGGAFDGLGVKFDAVGNPIGFQ